MRGRWLWVSDEGVGLEGRLLRALARSDSALPIRFWTGSSMALGRGESRV